MDEELLGLEQGKPEGNGELAFGRRHTSRALEAKPRQILALILKKEKVI